MTEKNYKQTSLFGLPAIAQPASVRPKENVEVAAKNDGALFGEDVASIVSEMYELYVKSKGVLREKQVIAVMAIDEVTAEKDKIGKGGITLDIVKQKLLNMLVSLTTGYGKTLIGVAALVRNYLVLHTKGVMTAPVKALCEQHAELLGSIFKDKDGRSLVIQVTGDTRGDTKIQKRLESGDYLVIVTTTDKLNIVLADPAQREKWGFGKDIGCIVIDEMHNMKDKERGAKLESAVKMCMFWSPWTMVVGLSATIGKERDLDEWKRWMGARIVYASPDERPVKLKVKVVTTVGNSDQDVERALLGILHEVKGSKWLVFVRSRPRSRYFHEFITNNVDNVKCAFHNAGIETQKEKKEIVDKYINHEIEGIVATTTLAQGVDTPCQVAVILDVQRYDIRMSKWEFLEESEFQQQIGRVRFPFVDEKGNRVKLPLAPGQPMPGGHGLAIAVCKAKDKYEVIKRLTEMSPVVSQIPNYFEASIICWCASGVDSLRQMVWMATDLINCPITPETAAGKIGWTAEYGFINVSGVGIDRNDGEKISSFELRKLAYALEHKINAELEPTIWGKAVARFGVQPRTILHMRHCDYVLREMETPPTPDEMYLLLLDNAEFKDSLVVRSGEREDETIVRLGWKYLKTPSDVDARLLKAYVYTCYDYISMKEREGGTPVNILHSAGDIMLLKQATMRMFMCAGYVLRWRHNPYLKEFQHTLTLVKGGSLSDVDYALLKSVKGIGMTYMARLRDAGIRTIYKFMEATDDRIATVLQGTNKKKVSSITVEKLKENADRVLDSLLGKHDRHYDGSDDDDDAGDDD